MTTVRYVALLILGFLTAAALHALGDDAWWVIPPVLFVVSVALLWRQWRLRAVLVAGLVALGVGLVLRFV